MNCPHCNKPQEDNALFCADCGASFESCGGEAEQIVSPDTIFPDEHIIPKHDIFASAAAPSAEKVSVELGRVTEPTQVIEGLEEIDTAVGFETRPFTVEKEKKEPIKTAKETETTHKPRHQKKKPFSLKKALIAGVAALSVAALVAGGLLFFFRDTTSPYTGYAADGSLYLLNAKTGKSSLIADTDAGNVMMSADKKRLFFLEYDDGGNTLYTCKLSDPKKTAQKVATDVQNYCISENGDIAVYVTDKQELYYTDFEQKDKLGALENNGETADGNNHVFLSTDGKTVLYRLSGGQLFLKAYGSEPQKIAENVTQSVCRTAGLQTFYYIDKDAVLFRYHDGKSSRLDTQVASVEAYADGTCYYVKRQPYVKVLYDFIIDDEDATIPEEPLPPDPSQYPATKEYEAAQNAYVEQKKLYNAALERAAVRDELRTTEYTISENALYYFDGREAAAVCETLASPVVYAKNEKAALYQEVAVKKIGKAVFSRVFSAAQVGDAVAAMAKKQTVAYIARGNVGIAVKTEHRWEGQPVWFAPNGNAVWFHIPNGSPTMSQRYYMLMLDANGNVLSETFVDCDSAAVDEESGLLSARQLDTIVLYDGDKPLARNIENFIWDACTETAYYLADYHSGKNRGTLMMYRKGEEPQKIADDVYEMAFDEGGRLTYIADYDAEDKVGDLYVYRDGKREKTAEEVQSVSMIATAHDFAVGDCLQVRTDVPASK